MDLNATKETAKSLKDELSAKRYALDGKTQVAGHKKEMDILHQNEDLVEETLHIHVGNVMQCRKR